jgi:hypothetical protein
MVLFGPVSSAIIQGVHRPMFNAPIHGRRRSITALLATGLATLVAAGTVLAGTPVTNGWRDHAYGGGAFRPSGDKPQSKLWYTEEGGGAVQWWGGMFRYSSSPPLSEFRIYKLTGAGSTWTATTTVVDRRDSSHGDYLWDEATNTLYVASVVTPNNSAPFAVPPTPDSVRIFRYSYNPSNDTYTGTGFAEIAGTTSTASPEFRGGAWTVTIAKDASNRLWIAWPKLNDVLYSTSVDDGTTWTDPAPVPAQVGNPINTGTLSHSDSAAVIAFGNGSPDTVGVMWSDQSGTPTAADNGYYFATIAAGADPTVPGNWSLEPLPAISGTTNDDADNHINLKTTSDGRVFMVGKARTDTINCATNKQRPLIPFYVRTAGGSWGSARLAGTVGDCNTRPQVVISEQLNVAFLFMTSPNGGGVIYVKSAPLSGPEAFNFRGAADQVARRGTPFIRSASETLIDDPSTTKQVVTAASGIAVIGNNLTSSAGGNVKVYLHNHMTLAASDSAGPAGSVSINGGAAATSNPVVSVAVPATDAGSGMSLVQLSNAADMSNATTLAYTTPVSWTLTAGLGTKTVYVRWRDGAGNWSSVSNDSIDVATDTTGPGLPGTPTHALSGSGQPGVPVRISWAPAADNVGGSGVVGYRLWWSIDGGPDQILADVTGTNYWTSLSNTSHTYRFRVQAKDAAGNFGWRRTGPTFRTFSYSESNSSVRYSGSWTLSNSVVYVGGKARWASTANRSATLSFNGSRVGWLARRGPDQGSARIYIDGSLFKTISLHASTTSNRQLVFTRSWSAAGNHSIRIVVVGTAGHPKVTLDQIYVLR